MDKYCKNCIFAREVKFVAKSGIANHIYYCYWGRLVYLKSEEHDCKMYEAKEGTPCKN